MAGTHVGDEMRRVECGLEEFALVRFGLIFLSV